VIRVLPTDMNGSARTPATGHLFNVNPDMKKLPKETAQIFHHLVAKLLDLSRHKIQDIQMAVALLCTRVQAPDDNSYKKITKVMQYLHCTKELTLTIKPGDSAHLWVDSLYTIHSDMCSHSGIFMMLRIGVAYSTLCKINTESSTEAELVAINDAMGQVLWTRHFLAAQSMVVPTMKIYQDKKSTILLTENGTTSSSKRTKHLNVWYFFIMDKINNGEVKVAYSSTNNMLSDFFTKPLHSTAFVHMHKKILNLPTSISMAVHWSVFDSKNYEMAQGQKQSGLEGPKRSNAVDGKGCHAQGLKLA